VGQKGRRKMRIAYFLVARVPSMWCPIDTRGSLSALWKLKETENGNESIRGRRFHRIQRVVGLVNIFSGLKVMRIRNKTTLIMM
jgi:hypothetical protein